MAKTSETITLGVGDLSINGADAGYLGGDVVFTASTESKDFRVGVPQHIEKRVITSFQASLKASLAQIDADTLALALGYGTASTMSGSKRVKFGASGSWTVATLANVKFVHTRPNGKTITVCFPKAQMRQDSHELRFASDMCLLQDITITALYDSTASANPLGYIEFQS